MLTLHGIIGMQSWATLIISRVLFLILLDRWQSFSQPCSDKVQSIRGTGKEAPEPASNKHTLHSQKYP